MSLLELLATSPIDISFLPYHLMVQIIKKVNLKTRLRLYRTNSSMRDNIETSKSLSIKNLEIYQDFIQFLIGFHRLLDEAGEHLLKGNELESEVHEQIDSIGEKIAEVGIEIHHLLPCELQRRLRLLLTLRQFCDTNCTAYKKMYKFIRSMEENRADPNADPLY